MGGKQVAAGSHSVGISSRVVTVSAITSDGLTAICTDRTGVEVRVPLLNQRSKGQLPVVGETWVLAQDHGQWMFSLFVGTSATSFTNATYGSLTATSLTTGSLTATSAASFTNGIAVSGARGTFASGIGVPDQAAPATPGTGANAFASGGVLRYVGSDGNTYATGCLTMQYTGPGTFPVTSTTPALITGLQCNVGVGTYRFGGQIFGTNGLTAAIQGIRVAGTATASSIRYTYLVGNYGAVGSLTESNWQTLSVINSNMVPAATFNAGFSYTWWFEGIINVSVAGNFGVTALCVTSNLDGWNVQPNSYFEVRTT